MHHADAKHDQRSSIVTSYVHWVQSSKWAPWLGLLLLYFLVMACSQGGWAKVGLLAVCFIAICFIAGIASALVESIKQRNAIAVFGQLFSLAILGWVLVAFSTDSWTTVQGWWQIIRDLIAFFIGSALGLFMFQLVSQLISNRHQDDISESVASDRDPSDEDNAQTQGMKNQKQVATIFVVYMISGWIGLSVAHSLFDQPLPVDPARFDAITSSQSLLPEHAERWSDLRVGVALSGGGYRAAVFHTGTLTALERLGIRAEGLSTVSGGSIIGAFYALGGDPVSFKDAVASGRFNLKKELLLFHNAIRLPLPLTVPLVDVSLLPWFEYSRSDVQARLLERVLLADRDWQTSPPRRPLLAVATTDLTYGLIIGKLPSGVVVVPPDEPPVAYLQTAYQAAPLTLAERVSISGAFPVAFPTMSLSVQVNAEAAGDGQRPLALADGGIGDNTGLDLLLALRALACSDDCKDSTNQVSGRWNTDVQLVSDGGAIFGVAEDAEGVSLLNRAFNVGSALGGSQVLGDEVVFFSPRMIALSPFMQFVLKQSDDEQDAALLQTESMAKQQDTEQSWMLSLDPSAYPDEILRALVALFPDSSRVEVDQALDQYLQIRRPIPEPQRLAWQSALFEVKDPDVCRANATTNAVLGLCDAAIVRLAFREELSELLNAFKRTSTLDDQLPNKRVDELFRLGQFMVYYRWPSLQQTLDAALINRW